MLDSRTKVSVLVEQSGEAFHCALDESLLQGMLRLGRRSIPVGCVNGGCGVCKVRIVAGEVRPLGPMSRTHVSAEEQAAGYALACRVAPVTAVRLEVAGKLEKRFRKSFASWTNA
jgi:ferredoxin